MTVLSTYALTQCDVPAVDAQEWARLSHRQREQLRATGYRHVLPVDGLQRHNADLPAPEWVPTQVQPGSTPLPIYPQPFHLPPGA